MRPRTETERKRGSRPARRQGTGASRPGSAEFASGKNS
ncbi:hypothetical protein D516_0374 [Rhodobacter sp. AKP1]|nr:hypothetical protein D516_0374 [Rhodobacter sp. AKP1]